MADNFNFRTWQKNALFNAITEQRETVDGFSIGKPQKRPDITDGQPQFMIRLKHEPSNGRFVIGWYTEDGAVTGPYAVMYRPHTTREVGSFRLREWPSVLRHVYYWLNAISAEQEPDEWEAYERQRLVRPALSEEFNTPFSSAEVDRIGRSFDTALNEIAQRQLLTAGQLQELAELTAEHIRSASSAKRIDWMTNVVNGLIKFGVERLAGSDAAKHVMNIIGEQFLWLTHQLAPMVEKVTLLLQSGGM